MTGQLSEREEKIGALKAKLSRRESMSRQLTDANLEISKLQILNDKLRESKVNLEESLARERCEKTDRVEKIRALEERKQIFDKLSSKAMTSPAELMNQEESDSP